MLEENEIGIMIYTNYYKKDCNMCMWDILIYIMFLGSMKGNYRLIFLMSDEFYLYVGCMLVR